MSNFLRIQAVLLLFAAGPALAFGPKRTASHFESEQAWLQSLESLQATAPASALGELQAGPLLVRKGDHAWAWLTMINRGTCTELTKPLARLTDRTEPTQVRPIDCGPGPSLRNGARAPAFPGYSPLTEKGRDILLHQVFETTWSQDREISFDGEPEAKALFSQNLRLHFEPPPGRGWKDELDIVSMGHAFSTKRTIVFPEMRYWPIQLLQMLEQRLKGGAWRFLLWANRQESLVESENQMTIAAVNASIMNAPGTLRFESNGRRICVGETCHELSQIETTRLYSAHVLVLEFDPSAPDQLTVKLSRVNGSMPSVTLRYDRRD